MVFASGYTAFLFAKKLGTLAEKQGLDCAFSSGVVSIARNVEQQYDAILLAPQVGYQLERVMRELPGKPVVVIPKEIFAHRDLAACLQLATSEIDRMRHNRAKGWLI